MTTGEAFDFETDFITATGKHRRVRSIGELDLLNGEPVGVIGVFQDVTTRFQMEEALRRTASTDELTQIANRGECNRVLERRILEARENETDLALLLIDLDGFKAVNDRCGHLMGDELLRLIGSRLRAAYLGDCFVARLGGDEFVVVASSPEDCARLDAIVDRLLADLRHSIPLHDGVLQVSGTIGISWLDDRVADRSDLMQRADVALYAAKTRRRGTAVTYADSHPAFAKAC